MTQDVDMIIFFIYIWDNLNMEKLGKVLTATLPISEAKACVKNLPVVKMFYSLNF